ncbi:MAG: hypothetical protein U1B80_04340, partial [Anaerolineaceae bacterium]|nr:hypothetical protein [Anaerolineaceae bacterium]
MITPVTHFLSATHLRRERLLPLEGRVLVSPGQNVSAAEVIAEAYLKDEHILIDVRQALGLPRQLNLAQFITRRVGERVEAGDILAQTSGIFRRVLRSPMPGEIIMISGGKIMLEVQRAVTRVLAGYHGEVTEVIENRGAIIEAHGALLQGVWGNGRIDQGMLLMPASAREIELLPDRFDVNTRGAVVFAGYCARAEA